MAQPAPSDVRPALHPDGLRRVFGTFPSGVTAVAAEIDGRPCGLAASSFTSVSLDPPLVSVCFSTGSTTWRRLAGAPRLGVSVLGDGHGDACRALARPGPDRFALLDWRATQRGAVVVDDASAWFDCSVERRVAAGDHELVLLRVHDYAIGSAEPLVFHGSRFRSLGEPPR